MVQNPCTKKGGQMSVGEKIKAFIDERGIKQSFLAERTGVSQSIMSKMLSGDYTITAINYHEICKALQVPMEQFFED